MAMSPDEKLVLRWVAATPQSPPTLDIYRHWSAMASLRDRGLVKRVRRVGWSANALTKAGEKALAELSAQS